MALSLGPQPGPSLDELHVVGGKHAKVAIWPVAAPPALVDHLDARDEVFRVKGDLGVVGCKESPDAVLGAWGPGQRPVLSQGCAGGPSPDMPCSGWALGAPFQQKALPSARPGQYQESPLWSPSGSTTSWQMGFMPVAQAAAWSPWEVHLSPHPPAFFSDSLREPQSRLLTVACGLGQPAAVHTCLVVIQGPGTEPLPTQPWVAVHALSTPILRLHLLMCGKEVGGPVDLGSVHSQGSCQDQGKGVPNQLPTQYSSACHITSYRLLRL